MAQSRTTKAALLASTAATAPVVTAAGVRETVTLGGRSYVLTAPSFADMGAFLDGQARSAAPTAADLAEAIRTALEEGEHGTDALDAAEAAEDAWVSFAQVHVITGPDATENIQAQAVELNRAMLVTRRARDRVIAGVIRSPAVLEIKAQQQAAGWQENCALVALLLRGWEGEGLSPYPEGGADADAVGSMLPMGDVAALAKRGYALMQPTADQGKA